jgi:hypothetical protein
VNRPTLAQRIVALDTALREIPHAFGGALALAYYAEPRATVDIDLNAFVGTEQLPEVAHALASLGVDAADPAVAAAIQRDGQGRVMWDTTPIDLFFAYDPFHIAAAHRVRQAPFADTTIPILGPEHLVVCKAVYDRPKDWVDIDAMLQAGTAIDAAEVLRWTGRIAGDRDPRFDRIASVLTGR